MKKQADCNLRVPDRIFTETILKQELPDLLEALCRIPAPSGQEDGRIAFIGDRLQEYSIPFFRGYSQKSADFFRSAGYGCQEADPSVRPHRHRVPRHEAHASDPG